MKKLKDGWEIKTLGEIATISSGGTPSRKNESYWNGSIPWVTTAEVKFNTIVDTAEKITDLGLSNSSAKLFPIGTILMAMYGQGKTRGQVAKLGIEATTNQACAAIILKENYHVEFYYQYLMSKYDDIREMSNSGGQENLSASIVKSIAIPVPPLEEQIQIAETLSTWDKAIQTTEKLLENSRRQKKALMQVLLNGKKRLSGFAGEWKKVKLGTLIQEIKKAKVQSPKQLELLTVKLHYKGTIPTGKKPNATEKGRTYYKRLKGELIVGRQNLHNGGIAIVDEKCDGLIASNAISSFSALEFTDIVFVLNIMSTPYFRNYVDSLTGGTGQKEISVKEILNIPVLVPELLEQQKIAEILSTADQEIETLQRKLECLKLEKGALMQRLL